MRKTTFHFLFVTCLVISFSWCNAQTVTISDLGFRGYLEGACPDCIQGDQLNTTCPDLKNLRFVSIYRRNIYDLNGIQYFTNLQELFCENNELTTLPPLPSGLRKLNCSDNKITSLPSLPPSLQIFYCHNNKLSALPELPALLQDLGCGSNPSLTVLPSLPATLTRLVTDYSPLEALPELPASLLTLNCFQNKLTSLPALPRNLNSLGVSYNRLTALPALPNSLASLGCDNNQLTSLPEFPPYYVFSSLACNNNRLTVMPELPFTLRTLECKNNLLKCLPVLPDQMNALYALGNSITCLPNRPTNSNFYSDISYTVCSSPNTNSCTATPPITGYVFVDDNLNGVKDPEERGYDNAKIAIGNYLFNTDSTGFYSIQPGIGTYNLGVYASDYPLFSVVPALRTVRLFSHGQTQGGNDFAMQPTAEAHDIKVFLTSTSIPRPGRGTACFITYTNAGTTIRNGTLILDYDAILHIDSSSVQPAASSSHGVRWDFTDFRPGQSKTIKTFYTVSQQATAGTPVSYKAIVQPLTDEYYISDNYDTLRQRVSTSYDPNFKEVIPAGDLSLEDVQQQDKLTYTIHFQNTGSDTAFVVRIEDMLSTNFEIKEIETLASSHAVRYSMNNHTAVWTFNDILLPDSTTNERASHGFVKYRIIPKNDLQVGDEIKNNADIFFDFNVPIKTNTTLNRVSMVTSNEISMTAGNAFLVYPNPSDGPLKITSDVKETFLLKIMNAEGQIIRAFTSDDPSTLSLDLSSEMKGLYLIQMVTDTQVWTKKIILN